ncbi:MULTISPECIES: GNAT family N-acetyltransferase [unclassified Streptococcus]|uniref:GNAT family N-acetyltransferase n=1 Tax=unclassified Streptococcus TaxID=2608887 RepID=UPI00359D8F14
MVTLTSYPIYPFSPYYQAVETLYHAAFPPEERPPYLLASLFALQSQVDFLAYYDKNIFAGFAYTVRTTQGIFVFLLAVNDEVRSKGYGSAMLRTIAEQAKGLPLVLCIEPMEETASNYDQRLRRLAFYEKNGFRRQYRQFHELNEVYEIVATTDGIDYQKLAKELNRTSLGLLKIRIT